LLDISLFCLSHYRTIFSHFSSFHWPHIYPVQPTSFLTAQRTSDGTFVLSEMFFKSLTLLALPLFSLAAPIPVPVEERRGLFLNLPLHKRLILFKRGLFSEALTFSDLGTPVGVGVAVANILKGPQQACKSAFPLNLHHHTMYFPAPRTVTPLESAG
jgi:hypothetical protein